MNEIYVNTPLPEAVAAKLKARARENGRCAGRELAQIAVRALAKAASGRKRGDVPGVPGPATVKEAAK